MTCCFEDFKTLIGSTAGQNRIKSEYVATFNRPVVGHCESSLLDMYNFLRQKNQKPILSMSEKLKAKPGSEILYIGGSRVDISQWNQKQIAEYLVLFPRARGHFETVEEEPRQSKEPKQPKERGEKGN